MDPRHAPQTSILSLPNELLEQIFAYLDWDPRASLQPSKEHIRNISLTNHQLRNAILPLLFRDVKLRLRWDDGSLIEPKLFRLRREHGHLMKHVRCVYVQTVFGHFPNYHFGCTPFSVPETLQDWLDPSDVEPTEQPTHRAHTHRQRVEDAARTLFNSPHSSALINESPPDLREHAEALAQKLFGKGNVLQSRPSIDPRIAHGTFFDEAYEDPDPMDVTTIPPATAATSNHPPANTARTERQQRRNEFRDLRLQLDALVLVMLCFPPNVRSMVFESAPRSRHHRLQDAFAHHVASAAIEIFGDRFETLSMITGEIGDGLVMRDTVPNTAICSKLEVVKRLTLSMEGHRIMSSQSTLNWSGHFGGWHSISHTVRDLAIWKVRTEPLMLSRLLHGFKNLRSLALNEVNIIVPLNVVRQRGTASATTWLHVLIDIRREMPTVILSVRDMQGNFAESFGTSAYRWLMNEAVPISRSIDFERETRLLEDFESFLPLWTAEDSVRGEMACKAREDGSLVDAAMSSRWRGLSKGRS